MDFHNSQLRKKVVDISRPVDSPETVSEYGLSIQAFGWQKFIPYSRVKHSKTIQKLSRRHIRRLQNVLTFSDNL